MRANQADIFGPNLPNLEFVSLLLDRRHAGGAADNFSCGSVEKASSGLARLKCANLQVDVQQ